MLIGRDRRAFPARLWRGAAMFLLLITLVSPAQASTPPAPSAGKVAQWVEVRRAYGLAGSPAAVAALAGAASDVGTSLWGFPATEEELADLDLAGRNAFIAGVATSVLPLARSMANFGGAWVDQLSGGDLVVQLVSPDPAALAAIQRLAPAGGRVVRVERVAHTERQLLAALRGLVRSWPDRHAGLVLAGAAVSEPANGLAVHVAGTSSTDLMVLSSELTAETGVDVAVDNVTVADDAACTSRDSCYTPMKAGNRVRDGSTTGGNWCTQGFLVVENGTSNVQFLTAGHCGVKGVGNTWYHQAYGLLGAEDGTAYGEDGYDVMKVEFPDSQKSALIYGVSGSQQLTASRNPITNEGVCFSGARTDAVVCGTVTAANATWLSQTCSCNVWGGDTNLAPIPGDSCAPLYSRVYITGANPYWSNTPIGIVDHESGYFAVVAAAEWALGVTVSR